MPKIAFVPSDALGGTTAENRKLIRSHCMLGKNKKKHKGKKQVRDRGDMAGQQLRSQPRAGVPNVAGPIELPSRRHGATSEIWMPAATECTLPQPVGTPWAFSFLNFAREINHRSRELLFKCLLPSFFASFALSHEPLISNTSLIQIFSSRDRFSTPYSFASTPTPVSSLGLTGCFTTRHTSNVCSLACRRWMIFSSGHRHPN